MSESDGYYSYSSHESESESESNWTGFLILTFIFHKLQLLHIWIPAGQAFRPAWRCIISAEPPAFFLLPALPIPKSQIPIIPMPPIVTSLFSRPRLFAPILLPTAVSSLRRDPQLANRLRIVHLI